MTRPHRPHRPLLGVSGAVLFVCLFLPAVHPCSTDETPLEFPFAWAPYFYGLAIAVSAVLGPRLVRIAAHVFRLTNLLFVVGCLALMQFSLGLGIIELTVAIVLWSSMGSGADERRLAVMTIVFGVMSTTWFLFWMLMGGTLWGLWLSFAASIATGIAGTRWHHHATYDDDEPVVPVAVVVAVERVSAVAADGSRSLDT